MYFLLPISLLFNCFISIFSSNIVENTYLNYSKKSVIEYCPIETSLINYCPPIININVYETNDTFNHNFCESRLQNYQPPEIYNAYTALVISIVPFISGFPKDTKLYNVAIMFIMNGAASFHYHYYLDWFGKQADEVSMILATYFGLWN